MVKVDLTGCATFLDATGPDYGAASAAHRMLSERTGKGAEFTGWLELPRLMKRRELKSIQSAANKIRGRSRALVVVGIGGSYLGARGAIELLRPIQRADSPRVFFAGNGLSCDYLSDIIEALGDDDFDVNVISKSGTTLEPALSFRVFRQLLEKKYGSAAKRHIFATTDANRGVLHDMARAEGWERFVVPDDVGGRYSVLSAVGLLPMAVAGIDIAAVLDAADETFQALDLRSPENPAWQYAAARQQLYTKGYGIELLASYEPSFRFMAEWWKQLYGESEGKNGIGIFPASLSTPQTCTPWASTSRTGRARSSRPSSTSRSRSPASRCPSAWATRISSITLPAASSPASCATAREAVKSAHIAGGVPNIVVSVGSRDERGFAQLVCFFELACAISGYMSGVNPFDQPGVEAYKKNMFKMLGKPNA